VPHGHSGFVPAIVTAASVAAPHLRGRAIRLDSPTRSPSRPRPAMTDADTARQLIDRYYAAFNRGDWDGMLALLTDDVVHDLNQGRRETGRQAFGDFLARMQRSYRERLADIVILTTDDGRRAGAEYVV